MPEAFVLIIHCWLASTPETPLVAEKHFPTMAQCQTEGHKYLSEARKWCERGKAECKPSGEES